MYLWPQCHAAVYSGVNDCTIRTATFHIRQVSDIYRTAKAVNIVSTSLQDSRHASCSYTEMSEHRPPVWWDRKRDGSQEGTGSEEGWGKWDETLQLTCHRSSPRVSCRMNSTLGHAVFASPVSWTLSAYSHSYDIRVPGWSKINGDPPCVPLSPFHPPPSSCDCVGTESYLRSRGWGWITSCISLYTTHTHRVTARCTGSWTNKFRTQVDGRLQELLPA